eukprot:scaffold2752_cov106-Isochrysis_galbana.AAC.2
MTAAIAHHPGNPIRPLLSRCSRVDLEALLGRAILSGAVSRESVVEYLNRREELKNEEGEQLFNARVRIGIGAAAALFAVGFIYFVGDNDPDRWRQ